MRNFDFDTREFSYLSLCRRRFDDDDRICRLSFFGSSHIAPVPFPQMSLLLLPSLIPSGFSLQQIVLMIDLLRENVRQAHREALK